MKICVIQPAYSTDYEKIDEYFDAELALLAACDESMDMIVMPELSDVPCLAKTREENERAVARFNARLLEEAKNTARRCHAMLFVNARSHHEKGLRNTTYAIDREGNIRGTYDKQHLVPSEVEKLRLDSDYSFEHTAPTVVEMEGYRFGFLTCYDFYFYEAFATLARENLDFVIGCSHQRSDTHLALEIFSQNLAYNTNTYVVRSSVSMDEDSTVGGASMVVAPTGEILLHMKSRVGLETVEIDPQKKYFKPAGFGNPPSAHHEYIEKGRRPWKYRPGGSAIVRHDAIMPYPRVCAHRGFSSILPENSLAAFAAAVAMGAEEIELDLWFTKDGVPVVLHDPTLDRVSNGEGNVWDYTLDELKRLDFGGKTEALAGVTLPTFEEVLKKLSSHVIMNIHLKTQGEKPEYLSTVASLIRKYDCEKYVYFMSGDEEILARLQRDFPHIPRCAGGGNAPLEIVDRALRFACKKVQLFAPHFNGEMIKKAHENNIICNVFFADDPVEAEKYLDMGIDTILTNDYHRIAEVVKKREKYVTY
ncbi:MAG: hypothetical protein E7657_01450 [Ruminococcaceae bacterium]|nr:hypothetical protein [Oscillospiraceae bacterium]